MLAIVSAIFVFLVYHCFIFLEALPRLSDCLCDLCNNTCFVKAATVYAKKKKKKKFCQLACFSICELALTTQLIDRQRLSRKDVKK